MMVVEEEVMGRPQLSVCCVAGDSSLVVKPDEGEGRAEGNRAGREEGGACDVTVTLTAWPVGQPIRFQQRWSVDTKRADLQM